VCQIGGTASVYPQAFPSEFRRTKHSPKQDGMLHDTNVRRGAWASLVSCTASRPSRYSTPVNRRSCGHVFVHACLAFAACSEDPEASTDGEESGSASSGALSSEDGSESAVGETERMESSEGSDPSSSEGSSTSTSTSSTSSSGGTTAMESSESTGDSNDTTEAEASTTEPGSTSTSPEDTGSESGDVSPADELIGWAAVNDPEQPGVTIGGAGGDTVRATSMGELNGYLESEDPLIIEVSGTLTGTAQVRASDKSILGLPGARIEGALEIVGDEGALLQNIIVRDLVIRGTGCGECTDADTVGVRHAHHVWLDHLDISDGDDGNLDITREADYITVSWTRFSYSSANRTHRFSNLVGSSDDATEDSDDLKITFHHNWWADNVTERMPRVRFGPVHIFNNYFSATGNNYCVRAGVEANLVVENNYFDNVNAPIDSDIGSGAAIRASGNVTGSGPWNGTNVGSAFNPGMAYDYELDAAQDVRAIVMAGAGPRDP